MTDLSSQSLPIADTSDGKPLAPLFTVQAIKSYKPSTTTSGYETLLPFKRKQVITVLDWDEKRDAIFGEYDNKRGWFPSSCTKILAQTGSLPLSRSEDSVIPSSAAQKRNAIPVVQKYAQRNPTPPPARTSTPRTDVGPSPRRINLLGASISKIPKMTMTSTVDLATAVTNLAIGDSNHVTLKNIKFCSSQGVPLILVNIIEFCRTSSILDMKFLFRGVDDGEGSKKLKSQFESDTAHVDLSQFSHISIVYCLKSFLLSLSEPFLCFDLFESFTAAAEIEEIDRRMNQFQYLLELIPQQNYNVAAYVTHFLRDCTSRSDVNNFTLTDAGLMFGSVYCRSHSLATIDETEKQKSSAVTQFLIENCQELFKTTEVINKKADKTRETRRKREKESMINYNRQESRRAKKAEKKFEKLNKRRHKSDDEVTIPASVESLLEPPKVKHSRSASSENVSATPQRLKRCLSGSLSVSGPRESFEFKKLEEPASPHALSPKKPGTPPVLKVTAPIQSNNQQVNGTSEVAKKNLPLVSGQAEQDVARTMAKFYQIGFYVMLLVFVLSHLLRSLL